MLVELRKHTRNVFSTAMVKTYIWYLISLFASLFVFFLFLLPHQCRHINWIILRTKHGLVEVIKADAVDYWRALRFVEDSFRVLGLVDAVPEDGLAAVVVLLLSLGDLVL